MPKVKISEYSATANSNTDVASINIDEGCAPSGINNAIRAVMGHLKDFQQGTNGDPFNGPVNGTLGATTASTANVTTLTTSSTVTHNGGTANGVTYLNGSKVLSSSATLTWNNSTQQLGFQNAAANGYAYIGNAGAGTNTDLAFYMGASEGMRLTSTSLYTASTINVGIGTSSPQAKLHINSGAGSTQFRMGPNSTSSDRALINYNSTTNRFTIDMSGNDCVVVDGSGNLGLGVTPSAWNSNRKAIQSGNASFFSAPSALSYSAVGANVFNNSGGTDTYIGSSSASLYLQNAGVHSWYSAASGTANAAITFIQAMTLDASGNLLVGKTNATGINAGAVLVPSGGFFLTRTGTSSSDQVIFYRGTAGSEVYVGTITTTGTATSYVTSSDYRLKNTIAPMTGALAKVALLKPCTYKWNVDGSDGEGFIAHELSEVVPQCVTGEKDAVDADGNPKYQGIDTSFLVATLTAAIQEQQTLITTLTARITALEGA